MTAWCLQCGVTSDKFRLYRSYGTFRRPELDRCNACLPHDNSLMVPLILSSDGDAYGFTSAPDDKIREFMTLPEKSDTHPTWTETGWSNSNSQPVYAARDANTQRSKADAEWDRNKLCQDRLEAEKIRLKNEVLSLKLELAEMHNRCRELQLTVYVLRSKATVVFTAAAALAVAGVVIAIGYVIVTR